MQRCIWLRASTEPLKHTYLMEMTLVLTWTLVPVVFEHSYLGHSVPNFLAAVLVALTSVQMDKDTPDISDFLNQLTQSAGAAAEAHIPHPLYPQLPATMLVALTFVQIGRDVGVFVA